MGLREFKDAVVGGGDGGADIGALEDGFANGIDGGLGGSVIHAEVGTTSGKSITINMLFRPSANFFAGENVCLFSGTVMSN